MLPKKFCPKFFLGTKCALRTIISERYIKLPHDHHRTNEHYYRLGHLSLFQRAICPGFETEIRPPGQKPLERLLSRVVEPGQKVPHAKKSLRPARFEPKTYCLAHGFLTNSPK